VAIVGGGGWDPAGEHLRSDLDQFLAHGGGLTQHVAFADTLHLWRGRSVVGLPAGVIGRTLLAGFVWLE